MPNNVKVVTGYIPIPEVINVSEARFRELGAQLKAACPCPVKAFDETNEDSIFDTWMWKWIAAQPWQDEVSESDPSPDPARFLHPEAKLLSNYVMHQKYEWLALAAMEDPYPETFVWIDYGVLKQINMTPETVTRFIEREQKTSCAGAVIAPGIRATADKPDPAQSWDRFCGSLVIVPRHWVAPLACEMKRDAMKTIGETKQVTIESNTLARVERSGAVPIFWYSAWWGATMFHAYDPMPLYVPPDPPIQTC